ncbi:MAG TPA: hypothetical protein VHX88_02190 [Solirubrobacteraceae bacterium]|jgi:cell division protein FtsL|nr:hypothetical protein [Solirubrobacteraceae bacterium]
MTPPSAAAAAPERAPRPAPPRTRPPARTRPATRRGVADALRALPDRPLLDRLIRGRFWIGIVTATLIGIVAMQIALLKLNSGIGRALTHETVLQQQNASLREQVSELSDPSRILAQATQLGMAMAQPGSERFLTATPALEGAAIGALHAGAGKATPMSEPPAASDVSEGG